MLDRALRRVARLAVRHPGPVLVAIGLVSAALALNIGRLQMRTDLVDLVAADSDAGRLQRDAIRTLGYGNQFFVIVEGGATEADAETMEAVADRLTDAMRQSGYFSQARSGVSDDELTELVQLYAWDFPAFADPAARERIVRRLSPDGVRDRIRAGMTGLVTPLGSMGASYFRADPLGMTELLAPGAAAGGGFSNFDLEWGSGARFFSRDHRALLVLATPRLPASDYTFSVRLMSWIHARIAELGRGTDGSGQVRVVPAGSHVYSEQNRRLIEQNMRTASSISVLGNLLLVLLVYRWIPAILLTVLPTGLALLWTAGTVALYPGVVNLVSLAFIAILAGLGDDQATYLFTRIPEERRRGGDLEDAVTTTFLTTGKSVLFCVLTTSTGTLALAFARFPPLAELGLILTIGLLMLAAHTLLTVPALMSLWWRVFPGGVSGSPFRVLPSVARRVAVLVVGRPRTVLAVLAIVLLAALAGLPDVRVAQTATDVFATADTAGVTGQRLLAERFGLQGAPTVFLLEGPLESVLTGSERLEAGLRALQEKGLVRAVAAPSGFLPSEHTQEVRRASLAGIDLERTAAALESAIAENGLAREPFAPVLERIRGWRDRRLTLDEVRRRVPAGLFDSAVAEVRPGVYLAAVTVYSSDPIATAALPAESVVALQREAGPFTEFSYDRVGRDLGARLVVDSRTALVGTLVGVVAIIGLGFRRLTPTLLVLVPIAYGVVAAFGCLALAGHRFSAMAFSSVPLIIGIGIDNGIHLVRRFLEPEGADVRSVLSASGPAVIQTNLTTIVGFGALMTSSFRPLAEMGLLTALGVGCTLVASLTLLPALMSVTAGARRVIR
jgi:uncharacterized protein